MLKRTSIAFATLLLSYSFAGAEVTNNYQGKGTAQTTVAQNERFTGTVELYVTDWCGYCKKAQNYLKSQGVKYVAYDIEKDSAANQRHKELGGRGVPLIIIGPNKMSGYNEQRLEYYLNNTK